MTAKTPRDDDFLGLDPREAEELAPVADALRADRREPDDPAFFDALHQRIMNEVAVTPVPGSRESAPTAPLEAARGWLGRLLGGSWRRGLVTGAMAVAAATLLTFLVLSRDRPQEPVRELPSPGLAVFPEERPDTSPGGLAIPDELWHEGFFAHSPLELATDLEAVEAAAAEDALDGAEDGPDEVALGEQWLTSEWLEQGTLGEVDPFSNGYDWGLGALDGDELRALDDLLGG